MAKYIVIDTCNWKSLVSKISYNDQLDQILLWIQQGDLIFLISNVLREEWNKHRKEEMEAITEKVKAHAAQFRRGQLFGWEIDNEPLPLGEAEELLKRQIETIDLIFESGLAIDISDAVRATVDKHFERRLPPFHKKLDSHKDAKILFPALEYVNSMAEQKELYFVSQNKTDFASADVPGNIHPILAKVFPDVDILYFEEWKPAAAALLEAGLRPMRKQPFSIKKTRNIIRVNRQAPILDQLSEFLTRRFAEFTFLPRKYVETLYPLKLADGPLKPDGVETTIYTNNEPLFQALSHASSHDQLTGQVTTIFQLLNQNWVNEVGFFNGSTSSVKLDLPDTYTDDARTLFESFDFDRLHLLLENESSLSTLERAFYSYQLSDWNNAILFYAATMNEAKTKGKKGLQFIAGFGVLALRQNLPLRPTFPHTQVDMIQSLSMEHLLASTKQEDLEGIHQELAEDTFINSNYDTLRDIHRLIQAEHRDRTAGTTYTGRRLITEFYQIHEYLVRNHLAYVHYGYYKQYVGLFIEGMLLSYASSEGLQGKVDFLTDDVLILMLFYCSTEDLKKFVRWYDINDVRRAADGGHTIVHCIRFLERYPTFVTTVYPSGDTLPLRRVCEELLPNLLVVLAIVQLAPEEISFIVQHLCTILRMPNYRLRPDKVRSINYFLSRHGYQVDPDVLFPIAAAVIASAAYYDWNTLSYLVRLQQPNRFFVFPQKDFDVFTATLSQLEAKPPETTTFYYLFDAYGLTSDPQQKSQLQEHLKRVIRIRPGQHDLYSIAVVHGILTHDPALFLLYAANIQRKVEIEFERSRKDGWLRPLINDLINYCFHQELSLPDFLRALLPKYDNYYDWLLHLDTFDYSGFAPEWLFDYYTLYFRRHFRSSSILAAFLLEYLKGHSLQVEVFQFYIDTYVREEE